MNAIEQVRILKSFLSGKSRDELAKEYGVHFMRIIWVLKKVSETLGIPLKPVVPEIFHAAVQEGLLTQEEVNMKFPCHFPSSSSPIKPVPLMDIQEVYKQYMEGKTARTLAGENGTTETSMSQKICDYRKKNGLPGKYNHFRVKPKAQFQVIS